MASTACASRVGAAPATCAGSHETNRGFLRALEGLRSAAEAIGEVDEAQRCDEFLHQLDPGWDRRSE